MDRSALFLIVALAAAPAFAQRIEARLELEMPGEWAVKLHLSGPVRDQVVLLYDFDDKGARPAVRRPRK